MIEIETHARHVDGTAETGSCLLNQPLLACLLLAGSQAVFQPTEYGPKQGVSLLGLARKEPQVFLCFLSFSNSQLDTDTQGDLGGHMLKMAESSAIPQPEDFM